MVSVGQGRHTGGRAEQRGGVGGQQDGNCSGLEEPRSGGEHKMDSWKEKEIKEGERVDRNGKELKKKKGRGGKRWW